MIERDPNWQIISRDCLNCLYADFKNELEGVCGWAKQNRIPEAFTRLQAGKEAPPIHRKAPYLNCNAWRPGFITKKIGI